MVLAHAGTGDGAGSAGAAVAPRGGRLVVRSEVRDDDVRDLRADSLLAGGEALGLRGLALLTTGHLYSFDSEQYNYYIK